MAITDANVGMGAALLKQAPAGKGRWWKVELLKNASANPIKITLMEHIGEGKTRAFSTPLAYQRTIANVDKVVDAADKVLAMVAGYESVVGDFNIPDGE